VPATADPDTPEQIEIDAARTPVAGIAAFLQEHVGQRPTAYLSGLKDAKTVGQWAAGRVTPRDAAALRLRHAYQAVRLLAEGFGDETASAWLFGINSHLGGEAPAFVLRHAELPEEITPVVLAARSFAESGATRRAKEHTKDAPVSRWEAVQRARNLASEIADRIRDLERSQARLEELIELARADLEEKSHLSSKRKVKG
jgi:hypothetical protein